MALLASIILSGPTGQIQNYYGSPGSIALPTSTHTPSSGIYVVSFATQLNLRNTLPPAVTTTITDTTARALISKLSTPVSMPAYTVAVKYLYTVSFTITVSQVQCLLLGLCTVVPADPDTNIMIRISVDEFQDMHTHTSST